MKFTSNGIELENGTKYSLAQITQGIYRQKVIERNLCILSLNWESHRNFDGVYEHRIMTLENANKFREKFVGVEVYFGEIAGKHSDIHGELEADEIIITTNIDRVIDFLQSHPNGLECNHSFIERICDNLPDDEYEEFDAMFDYDI